MALIASDQVSPDNESLLFQLFKTSVKFDIQLTTQTEEKASQF